MNSNENQSVKELIKKFQFFSEDRKESSEILVAELLVGKKSIIFTLCRSLMNFIHQVLTVFILGQQQKFLLNSYST